MSAKKIFYAAPLCSPARGSSLTGQFSFRFGIPDTHTSGLRVGEIAIAEILKSKGYAMGFFRKRHIDWVQPDEVTSRGDCSPPSHHGFDEVFAKTSAVPTWNPTVTPDGWASNTNKVGEPWKGSFAYMDNGKEATENLESDDSCVVIEQNKGNPFFAAVWFHTPHEPGVAGEQCKNGTPNVDKLTSIITARSQRWMSKLVDCETSYANSLSRMTKLLEAMEAVCQLSRDIAIEDFHISSERLSARYSPGVSPVSRLKTALRLSLWL